MLNVKVRQGRQPFTLLKTRNSFNHEYTETEISRHKERGIVTHAPTSINPPHVSLLRHAAISESEKHPIVNVKCLC